MTNRSRPKAKNWFESTLEVETLRAPKRRYSLKREIAEPPSDVRLEELAREVRYVGSPEHKDIPSFSGMPRPRGDASICDRSLADDLETVQGWLRDAMTRGAVGGEWEGSFPRYVWSKQGSLVYEGRLVNRGLGEYKGYPLQDDEWPVGIEEIDWDA